MVKTKAVKTKHIQKRHLSVLSLSLYHGDRNDREREGVHSGDISVRNPDAMPFTSLS